MRFKTLLLSLLLLLGISLNFSHSHADAPTLVDSQAKAIVEKHLEATGSRATREATHFIDTVTETERNGITEKGRRVDDRRTRRFYALQDGASGKIESGFDGTRGWRRAPFFRGYLDDNDNLVRATRQPRQELSEYQQNGMMLKKLDDETIEGVRYLVIESQVNIMGSLAPLKYYFDATSYLLMRSVQGDAIKVTTLYSDHKMVDGRMVAHTRTIITPQFKMVSKTISVKYLATIDERIFEFSDKQNESASEKADVAISKASSTASRDPLHKLDEASKTQAFQLAWKTINDSYWDSTFHGVDWQKVREKYIPLVVAEHTNLSFHELLNRMLGELGRSHLKIMAPHQVVTATTSAADIGKIGATGLDMRYLDNELVVTKIDDDNSDNSALVKVGDVIESINGKTPAEIFEKYKRQGSGFVGREASGIVRAARAELAGDTSTKPSVEIRDTNEVKRTVNLTRKKANPARQLNFESKRIGDNIAYVRFNLFIGELAQKFSEALITHKDSKALIVDIRGNVGGIGDLATTLASMLTSIDGTLGESRFRYETRQFSYAGSKNAYQGKVIFLADGFSASTSEVISGGLQHAKRITVLGEQTTGAVLPSLMTVLPTGGAMQYAISDFRLPHQRVLEGEGVIPDETIKFNRRDVIAGRDPVLARALALLAN